jgi:hypothetical protein
LRSGPVIAQASKIVLPGVGAFEDAIAELRNRDLVGPFGKAIDSGKPFLGICLGLQLLFEISYENGEHEGLGVLRGKVVRFDVPPEYKVPHMGWNAARILRPAPILAGIDEGPTSISSTRTTSCRTTLTSWRSRPTTTSRFARWLASRCQPFPQLAELLVLLALNEPRRWP